MMITEGDKIGLIVEFLDRGESVMFQYDMPNLTSYSMCIVPDAMQLGALQGGNSYGRWLVGILRRGAWHFDFRRRFEPSYVGEKLGLSEEDAKDMVDLLNAIRVKLGANYTHNRDSVNSTHGKKENDGD